MIRVTCWMSPSALPIRGSKKNTRSTGQGCCTRRGKVTARRVWGAESPIELFLLKELLRRGVTPTLQMLVYDDWVVSPVALHLWRDIEFRHSPRLIAESDMYFPEKKI